MVRLNEREREVILRQLDEIANWLEQLRTAVEQGYLSGARAAYWRLRDEVYRLYILLF